MSLRIDSNLLSLSTNNIQSRIAETEKTNKTVQNAMKMDFSAINQRLDKLSNGDSYAGSSLGSNNSTYSIDDRQMNELRRSTSPKLQMRSGIPSSFGIENLGSLFDTKG
jgi:hypothetical protein